MQISVDEALERVTRAMIGARVSEDNARAVARALVLAEASGQGGHGLRRLPSYRAQSLSGKVDGFARPTSDRPRPGVLRIDAGLGFAYPALDLAVRELPDAARACGIAIAAIRRSHHAGVMGLTVERFAQQGLVALMFANAPASIAPAGGRRPVYGTNPIAFAAPVTGGAPMVVDLALSRVARGKIMAAQQKGEPIPEGWALDAEGRATTDADAAMGGTMLPMGDAKGAALALMVETMAAAITGAHLATEASSLFDGDGPPPELGQTIIAIDPVATGEAFAVDRIAELAGLVTAEDGARLPGSRGAALRLKAMNEGITVPDDLIELLFPADDLQ